MFIGGDVVDTHKKEITESVGARIRYFRRMKDMSQEELALSANINPAYFGQVERGLKCPTIDTLCKIAGALEVTPTELLRGEAATDMPEPYVQRARELLSRVPQQKMEQVLRLMESLVDIL